MSPPSARITVRQTPFTARLSPGVNSIARGALMRNRLPPLVGLHSTISPTVSMRPVNITLYQDIRTERLHATIDERGRPKSPSVQQREAGRSEHVRRHVEPDQIH